MAAGPLSLDAARNINEGLTEQQCTHSHSCACTHISHSQHTYHTCTHTKQAFVPPAPLNLGGNAVVSAELMPSSIDDGFIKATTYTCISCNRAHVSHTQHTFPHMHATSHRHLLPAPSMRWWQRCPWRWTPSAALIKVSARQQHSSSNIDEGYKSNIARAHMEPPQCIRTRAHTHTSLSHPHTFPHKCACCRHLLHLTIGFEGVVW